MTEQAGKYCVDCKKFALMNPDGWCWHPDMVVEQGISLVWGKLTPLPIEAKEARSSNGKCGPDALLFEQKEKK